jgi:hypothetical protein
MATLSSEPGTLFIYEFFPFSCSDLRSVFKEIAAESVSEYGLLCDVNASVQITQPLRTYNPSVIAPSHHFSIEHVPYSL